MMGKSSAYSYCSCFKRLMFFSRNLDYKMHPYFLIRNVTLVSFIILEASYKRDFTVGLISANLCSHNTSIETTKKTIPKEVTKELRYNLT